VCVYMSSDSDSDDPDVGCGDRKMSCGSRGFSLHFFVRLPIS